MHFTFCSKKKKKCKKPLHVALLVKQNKTLENNET